MLAAPIGDAIGKGRKKFRTDTELEHIPQARVRKRMTGAPENVFFLKRDHNGILHHVDTAASPGNAEDRVIAAVIDKVGELEAAGKHDYTIRTFQDEFAGRWEGYGKDKLKRAVNKAVEEGESLFLFRPKQEWTECRISPHSIVRAVGRWRELSDSNVHCPIVHRKMSSGHFW